MSTFHTQDLDQMEKRYRANLINSLSGFKSANLIGTKNNAQQENLTLISSVFHVGSEPATLGLVFRPNIVPRHGYENIQETRYFTVNHVEKPFYKAAHQSSARYSQDISEFKAVGLTPEYLDNFFAPYVKESNVKIGCRMVEKLDTTFNPTHIVIAEIVSITIKGSAITQDGSIDYSRLDTVSVTGLDTYYNSTKIEKLAYPKP